MRAAEPERRLSASPLGITFYGSLVLSCRPDATCALGFGGAGRRKLPAVGRRTGEGRATFTALLSGEMTGAMGALFGALEASCGVGRIASWPTVTLLDSLLRETK